MKFYDESLFNLHGIAVKQKPFPDSSSLLLPLFFLNLAYQNFRQTFLSTLDAKTHGTFIVEPAETISLRDHPRDNGAFDIHALEMQTKSDIELALHTMGLTPDERIPPQQHHRFTAEITPHLTMDGIQDINIAFEVVIRNNNGDILDTGYELVTEEVDGFDETFIVINPVNPAYTLLPHPIRIDTREIYEPHTVTMHQATYAFYIEAATNDLGATFHSERLSYFVIDLEESDDEDEIEAPHRNSFSAFMDDSDDEDDYEEEDTENLGKTATPQADLPHDANILGDNTNQLSGEGEGI